MALKRDKEKNQFYLNAEEFEDNLPKLVRIYHERVREVVGQALLEVAGEVQEDVIKGLAKQYLPAGGQYETGKTKTSAESLQHFDLMDLGSELAVPIGFDYTKKNAGTYLITGTGRNGTPRRAPDKKLREIFVQKTYMKKRREQMSKKISQLLGGQG